MKCSPSINFTTRGKTLSLAHCCGMIFFNTYVQHPTVRRRHVRHARCAHTDDDNPASVSQKGKMGGEDECAKEEEVKGGRAKNRWKVGQRGSRHSVCQSVSRRGGGWWGRGIHSKVRMRMMPGWRKGRVNRCQCKHECSLQVCSHLSANTNAVLGS